MVRFWVGLLEGDAEVYLAVYGRANLIDLFLHFFKGEDAIGRRHSTQILVLKRSHIKNRINMLHLFSNKIKMQIYEETPLCVRGVEKGGERRKEEVG